MDHISYVETLGMSERELADHLHGVEAGVLALADGGDAYAVPVSFRYDDGRFLLRLTDDGDSEKVAFARATDSATFVAFGAEDTDSWSVLARGPLVEPEDGEVAALLADPDAFGPVRVFDEDVSDVEVRVFELLAESVTGRRTAGVDAWRAIAGTGGE
ncbi:MAG: pyridoxamine 5'-phosphate oxidase family protein [Haloarculaceae archaeon]